MTQFGDLFFVLYHLLEIGSQGRVWERRRARTSGESQIFFCQRTEK